MNIRNWEHRNSDMALYETHRELESQRLQQNYIKRINGLTMLKERKLSDVEHWKCELDLSRKLRKNLPRN